jgi:SAM-dependent methyltransferase
MFHLTSRIFQKFKVIYLVLLLGKTTRFLARVTHKLQYLAEWGHLQNNFFDHYIDQYWQWPKTGEPIPWERGILSVFALQFNFKGDKKPRVLELCCGDGFNSSHFYSSNSESLLAVDFSQKALSHAKRNHSRSNVQYSQIDLTRSFPDGKYNNIIWDAGIEYFTKSQIKKILSELKEALGDNGILSGYTLALGPSASGKDVDHGVNNKEKLQQILEDFFKFTIVFDTKYKNRTNLYFMASDNSLPFYSHE